MKEVNAPPAKSPAPSDMSSRGQAIARTLRGAIAALRDHEKHQPAEVDQIVAALIADVRSWRPVI